MKIIKESRINEDEVISWKEFVNRFKAFPHKKASRYQYEMFGEVTSERRNVSLELKGHTIFLNKGDFTITPGKDAKVTLYDDFDYGVKIQDRAGSYVLYIFYAS